MSDGSQQQAVSGRRPDGTKKYAVTPPLCNNSTHFHKVIQMYMYMLKIKNKKICSHFLKVGSVVEEEEANLGETSHYGQVEQGTTLLVKSLYVSTRCQKLLGNGELLGPEGKSKWGVSICISNGYI